MNNADFYLKRDIENILFEGYLDENPRPKYADGAPAHTLSINHVYRSYDLSKGEFPICTLRPIAWKSAIREIFAIYQNQSNKVSEFERLGCGWWKDWMLEDGTIGRSYPYNLESHRPEEMKRSIVKVKRKLVEENDCNIDSFYLGETDSVKNFEEWEIDVLKKMWENMISLGSLVHNKWHWFSDFLKDVRYLPQYFLAREDRFSNWILSKDYYASNAYSKDTCVFLKSKENVAYSEYKGVFELTDKKNRKRKSFSISGFSNIENLDHDKLKHSIEKNKSFSDNEFTLNFISNNDEYVYRYELSRNQLNELIKGIITNPYGRRHMMDFWNWANIDKKSLVECAFLTIWNVRGKHLDMILVQRSGDMITASGAGGINEVQYIALMMMIAKHTGYEVGVFTHLVVNEQIYNRHIEQANELLDRYSKHINQNKDAKLIFNPKANDFYNFTIDDFKMENYNPVKPQLKLDLGI